MQGRLWGLAVAPGGCWAWGAGDWRSRHTAHRLLLLSSSVRLEPHGPRGLPGVSGAARPQLGPRGQPGLHLCHLRVPRLRRGDQGQCRWPGRMGLASRVCASWDGHGEASCTCHVSLWMHQAGAGQRAGGLVCPREGRGQRAPEAQLSRGWMTPGLAVALAGEKPGASPGQGVRCPRGRAGHPPCPPALGSAGAAWLNVSSRHVGLGRHLSPSPRGLIRSRQQQRLPARRTRGHRRAGRLEGVCFAMGQGHGAWGWRPLRSQPGPGRLGPSRSSAKPLSVPGGGSGRRGQPQALLARLGGPDPADVSPEPGVAALPPGATAAQDACWLGTAAVSMAMEQRLRCH